MTTTFTSRGANTWVVQADGEAYRVTRTRGVGSDDQPRGWGWRVWVWRTSRSASGWASRRYWHSLPPRGPKAAPIIAATERMLADVRLYNPNQLED
jgi:hypothetical protein